MPELPEVEVIKRGIQPHITGQTIRRVIVRHYGLRWPVPEDIMTHLTGQCIQQVDRRGKYLLLRLAQGTVIMHLGMSGRLRILQQSLPAEKHDHIDLVFANKKILRFTDPRRFGAFLWTNENPEQHPLLTNLGCEPLTAAFSGRYLWQHAQSRHLPVKSFLMDHQTVVGIGNIYANEALFVAGIHPLTSAKQIELSEYMQLVKAVKIVLRRAIRQGGTTLKDFVNSNGEAGYFAIQLAVYGREGLACKKCRTLLRGLRLNNRSTVYCPRCQLKK